MITPAEAQGEKYFKIVGENTNNGKKRKKIELFNIFEGKSILMQSILLFLSFNTLAFFISLHANAQLFVTGGGLVIDSGAVINLKGDLISNTDINGTGKIILNGTIPQNVSMNNFRYLI